MHMMFSCSHKFNIYLQQKSFNKRYIKASRRRGGPGPSLKDYFLQVRTSMEDYFLQVRTSL
jgi:hypothetical protein